METLEIQEEARVAVEIQCGVCGKLHTVVLPALTADFATVANLTVICPHLENGGVDFDSVGEIIGRSVTSSAALWSMIR